MLRTALRNLPAPMRLLLLWLGMALACGLLLRCCLMIACLPAGQWIWPGPLLLVAGVLADLGGWLCVLALPAALLMCARGAAPRLTTARVLVAAGLAGIALGAVVEWYFFDEFSARFNHIAVDYLIYPNEVAGTVKDGYPLWPWLSGCVALGVAIAWWAARWVAAAPADATPWPRRLALAGGWLAAGAIAFAGLWLCPRLSTGDRRADEIARNGVVSMAQAAWSASLAYDAYYATLPHDQIAAPLDAARGPDGAAPALCAPKQIVVLLEESFGQEFIGALGGRNASSPEFDRWSSRGLLFTNLIATGNRTVRGMEGVLASLPPVPPDSIVKRSGLAGMPTLASACKAAGYATEFFYGGVAAFDHMAPWLSAQGWDRIVDDGLFGSSAFPPDAFRTTWGVNDDTLLDAVVARQKAARQSGEQVFITALTVGNHKPFLVPPPYGKPKPLGSTQAWRYSIMGVVVLLVLGLGWWRGRGSLGYPLLCALSLLAVVGAWIFISIKVTSSDERLNAVAFADHAIGRYLDTLEREGLLDETLVLVVADHGARVYGAQDIPFSSYRIPALLLVPGGKLAGEHLDRLCSQIDLGPTLLDAAGITIPSGFFGHDQRGLPATGGRALLQHNRDIALLDDQHCVVLGLNKAVHCYNRQGEKLLAATSTGPDWQTPIAEAEAIFGAAAATIDRFAQRTGLAH